MPLVIHSDQGREFENGLMISLCFFLGCTKTRTAPYHPESDGMIERFHRTCLMMLSMFVNDRRDNRHELLPYVMHAYRTSVHESTGYSPFRLMMGKECSRQRTSNKVLTSPLLNHCVLVQWLSDRVLMSVMLHQHRPSMCPVGRTWPVTIRVKQLLGNWTDRLISPDMFCHRFSSETWIIWTVDFTQ